MATVRKPEAYTLHPQVDRHGVHWFDAHEVEQVAEQIAKTGRALECGAFVNEATDAKRRCREAEEQLQRLQNKHEQWKVRVELALAKLIKSRNISSPPQNQPNQLREELDAR